jgi:hypothetical protein
MSMTSEQDWKSPESIINASYECISGRAGEERDWARLKTLYLPDARLIPIELATNGKPRPNVMNVDQFIESRSPFLMAENFFEWETERHEDRCGSMAHVWSTYEAAQTLHGSPIRCGVNSIQLWDDGTRWWIMSITWDAIAAKTAAGQ